MYKLILLNSHFFIYLKPTYFIQCPTQLAK